MLSSAQKNSVSALIRDVGKNCIAKYFRNLKQEHISFKTSPSDPVSIADKEAEELLKTGLLQILPGSVFLGEESFALDASLLDHLALTDTYVWVVDPIDGTQSFVTGKEGFGTMIALLHNGELLSSWMYDVCEKRLVECHRGAGVTINDEALPPAAPADVLRGMVGWKIFKHPSVEKLNTPSAGYSLIPARYPSIVAYTKLLQGELDFLVYKMTYPWDHLPGMLMVRDIGGACIRWSGEPFQPADRDAGLIVARTPGIAERIRMDIADQLSQYSEVKKLGT